jgi:hypothetical protein
MLHRLIVVAVLAAGVSVAVPGCTGGTATTGTGSATIAGPGRGAPGTASAGPARQPVSHAPGSPGPVPASCPVTVPRQARQPAGANDAGGGLRWYGNGAVWVLLSVSGVLGADPQQRPWASKVPWWRSVPGVLTIHARPVGTRAAGFHADIPSGYDPTGFQPSGLYWPRLGCWQVTGTLAGRALTFTVWVKAGYG